MMHRVVNLDHRGRPLRQPERILLPDGTDTGTLRLPELKKRLRALMQLTPEHHRMGRDALAEAYRAQRDGAAAVA